MSTEPNFKKAHSIELFNPNVRFQVDALDGAGVGGDRLGFFRRFEINADYITRIFPHYDSEDAIEVRSYMPCYLEDDQNARVTDLEAWVEAPHLLHFRVHVKWDGLSDPEIGNFTYCGAFAVDWAWPEPGQQ